MSFAQSLMRFDAKLRPLLSQNLPAWAFVRAYSISRNPMLHFLSNERPQVDAPSFPVEFNGLTFRNDLGNAAGYDKNGDLLPLNYFMGAGFGVVGTVLIKPNKGKYISSILKVNPWTPLPASDGAINTLGLPSKGVDYVVRTIDEFREKYQPEDFPIVASVMGHPEQEGKEKLEGTLKCIEKLFPYVDIIKLNDSCPNIEHKDGGLESRIGEIVDIRDSYRSRTGRKVQLSVKLASFGEVSHTISFMTKMGIDMLAGVNTQINYEELRVIIHERDLKIFDYYIKNYLGGVSGNPIRRYAYYQIKMAAEEIRRQGSPLKLDHIGGIGTNENMIESRAIGDPVIIREWYTRMIKAMEKPIDNVYRDIVTGS